MPFDKKIARLANYQERRSFPWPLLYVFVPHSESEHTWKILKIDLAKFNNKGLSLCVCASRRQQLAMPDKLKFTVVLLPAS